jgi:multicomponent Na+:H+ antiporter subunit E
MGIRAKTKLKHSLSLFLVLAVFWLLLSGTVSMRFSEDGLHLHGLILALGLVSCALVVLIALRMELMAHITQPLRLHFLRLVRYWVWLAKKIVLANVDVARRIVDPNLPISPTLVRTCSTQRSSVARTVYANSITLTPGTVSIEVTEDHIVVHALTRESANELAACGMDERVSDVEKR